MVNVEKGFKRKGNLDEAQEQKLLRIEHNGCWIGFFGLVAAIFVQAIIGITNPWQVIGEGVVMLVMAVYLVGASLRHGLWDRRLKADGKTNMIASLIGGVVAGAVNGLTVYNSSDGRIDAALITFAFGFVFVFILCFVALSLLSGVYKRRAAKLNSEDEEEIAPEE